MQTEVHKKYPRKASESKVKKKKVYLKHFKVCKKRMRRMEIKGLVGVLHEPVKIAPKEKVWLVKTFLYEAIPGRATG